MFYTGEKTETTGSSNLSFKEPTAYKKCYKVKGTHHVCLFLYFIIKQKKQEKQ